jgi:hypothetical protein
LAVKRSETQCFGASGFSKNRFGIIRSRSAFVSKDKSKHRRDFFAPQSDGAVAGNRAVDRLRQNNSIEKFRLKM